MVSETQIVAAPPRSVQHCIHVPLVLRIRKDRVYAELEGVVVVGRISAPQVADWADQSHSL